MTPAPKEIQEKINEYVNSLEDSDKGAITQLPLITVITVVYNGAKHLEETIKSVLNQTYPNVEYIIIDGGSTDGTLDIIKKYEDKIDYWVSEPDEGIYDAMNKGVVLANGDYIYFIGSDDKLFQENVLYSIINKVNFKTIKNLLVCPIKVSHKKNISYPKLSGRIPIVHHQGVIFNKKALKNIGLYNLNYKFFSDFDLILRYLKKCGFKYIKEVLCIFNSEGISLSNKFFLSRLKEYIVIYLKYGGRIYDSELVISIIRLFYYYFRAIFKRLKV